MHKAACSWYVHNDNPQRQPARNPGADCHQWGEVGMLVV
jgi:hypothetical protein